MGFSKTRLFAVLFALLAASQSSGIISLSPECLKAIEAILGSGMIWGIRDAIGRVEGK